MSTIITTDRSTNSSSSLINKPTLIWISYFPRKDQPPVVKSLEINRKKDNSKSIKEKIKFLFEMDAKIDMRLRNRKGHLVPVNEYLAACKKERPYSLEIFVSTIREPVHRYDLALKENRLSSAFATKTLINYYMQRIAKLESSYLNNKIQLSDSFQKQIEEVENRLNFIESRFKDVGSSQWKGIFKKPVLW